MGRTDGLLFAELDLRRVLDSQRNAMTEEIDRYDSNRLLNTSIDDLAAFFVEKCRIDPVEIQDDQITVHQGETSVDVRHEWDRAIFDRSRPALVAGVSVTVSLPFTGEPDLFRCQPSTFTLNPPRAHVVQQSLILTYTTARPEGAALKQWFDQTLGSIRSYLDTIRKDVVPFNEGLLATARSCIVARRERLLQNQGLAASLGLPLETRAGAPRTYAVPDIRRRTPPQPPRASSTPYVPEPALEEAHYDQILDLIRPMAITMERDPTSFATLGEENLRSLFLATLNSHFQGRATGETFNAAGKTDILIRVDDRNVFIAECKIWKGPQSLSAGIDQLLSYAAWRDTKTAVLLFSRNKDFTSVIQQIDPVVQQHSCFKTSLGKRGEAEFRYRFCNRNDVNRELTLTVLAFNVPE